MIQKPNEKRQKENYVEAPPRTYQGPNKRLSVKGSRKCGRGYEKNLKPSWNHILSVLALGQVGAFLQIA